VDRHRLAELRSLAYHRAIAARLAGEPAILARARARVADWLCTGSTHVRWATTWQRILSLPLPEVAAALVDPGEAMTAARQSTPFAGALSSPERWAIWRSFAAAS
jgi:hypothetical protein